MSIILGLIFIIYPVFSSVFTSQVLGLSILIFGIFSMFSGITGELAPGFIVTGILLALFGIILITNIFALPILVAFQFYIIGVLMIFFAIFALYDNRNAETIVAAILIIILAIIIFLIGSLTIFDPIIAPILIGLALIVHGVHQFLMNKYIET